MTSRRGHQTVAFEFEPSSASHSITYVNMADHSALFYHTASQWHRSWNPSPPRPPARYQGGDRSAPQTHPTLSYRRCAAQSRQAFRSPWRDGANPPLPSPDSWRASL